jgi:hypothetical protein
MWGQAFKGERTFELSLEGSVGTWTREEQGMEHYGVGNSLCRDLMMQGHAR